MGKSTKQYLQLWLLRICSFLLQALLQTRGSLRVCLLHPPTSRDIANLLHNYFLLWSRRDSCCCRGQIPHRLLSWINTASQDCLASRSKGSLRLNALPAHGDVRGSHAFPEAEPCCGARTHGCSGRRKRRALRQARKVSIPAADKERAAARRGCGLAVPAGSAPAVRCSTRTAHGRKDFLCLIPAPARSPSMNHEPTTARFQRVFPASWMQPTSKKALS